VRLTRSISAAAVVDLPLPSAVFPFCHVRLQARVPEAMQVLPPWSRSQPWEITCAADAVNSA